MNLLALDFETYYTADYSLRKMTVAEYVHDPRFLVFGLAIRRPDGSGTFERDVPAALLRLQAEYGQDLERVTVVMHNGHFDGYVLAHRYHLRPRYLVDTLQLANAIHGRRGAGGAGASLHDLAESLGLGTKGDITDLCGVRILSGKQQVDLAAYAINDVHLTYGVAQRLLPELSRPEAELPIAMHTLRLHNERGLRVRHGGIAPLLALIAEETADYFEKAEIKPEQAGAKKDFDEMLAQALAKTGRLLPMKAGKRGLIPATAKTDPAMPDLLADGDTVVAALAHARLAVGSEQQAVRRLERLAQIALVTGGVLPVHLVYYGAHTGRFAGGGKFNLQNLPKEGLGSQIRELLVPRDGHEFVIADLAQIEARITAWLAQEHRLLDAFARGIDIYSEEASAIFGCPVRRPRKDDAPDVAKRLESLRQTGKQEVLGLGFQLGALKFANTLRKDPKTAKLFASGELSPKRCVQIVAGFRARFPGIPQLWRDLEEAFRQVVTTGNAARVGAVSFSQGPGYIRLHLPSGRILRYHKARLETRAGAIRYLDAEGHETEYTPTGAGLVCGKDEGIYGGKLLENIAQAIARDILVDAILRLEQRGLTVVAHIHDEIILESPLAEAQAHEALLMEEMLRPLSWLPGLPLGAESCIRHSLSKKG